MRNLIIVCLPYRQKEGFYVGEITHMALKLIIQVTCIAIAENNKNSRKIPRGFIAKQTEAATNFEFEAKRNPP